jgi:uncharacterized lipoprotein YddW (UPF0748 family)
VRVVTATIVALSILVSLANASTSNALDAWRYADAEEAQAAWIPSSQSPTAGVADNGALLVHADFAEGADRAYWDAAVAWDLSRYGRMSFSVGVDGAAAVGHLTIYFRSGDGWYGASFAAHEGKRDVTLRKTDFNVEGEPTGWGSIDAVRLAIWAGAPRPVTATYSDLVAHSDDLVVVRGARTRTVSSGNWPTVQRVAEDMTDLLAGLGVQYGAVEDADVEAGALTDAKIALLPYNPDTSAAQEMALADFLDRGGKAVACYALPEGLLSRFGLASLEWRRAAEAGEYAAIALDAGVAPGVPASIHQASWNARIPALDGATTLGEWVNADGELSGLPAVTLSDAGAFVGHVLLPVDIPGKRQFLLAVLSRLAPGSQGELADAYLARAEAVAGFVDGEAVRTFIQANRPRLPDRRRYAALARVTTARKRIEQARASASKGHYDAAFAAAREGIEAMTEGLLTGTPSRNDDFRGVWCHSAFGVDGWTWDEALGHLAAQGFTAVVPNMLWGGLAYYPSDYLPVADEVAERGDQIEACLAAAKQHDIDVHVWKVNWGLQNAPAAFIQQMRDEGRLQRHRDGSELEWLCPSHPENFELEKASLLEVARNYAVDGIHFDYIRYPHGSACYDDGCRERFQEATGLTVGSWPADVVDGEHADAFADWRREQITRLVRAVSSEARAIRPGIQISAAVFRDYPNCRRTVGQDWVEWVKRGYLDFVCPMNYTDDEEQFATWVSSQQEYVGNRVPLYPGIGASAPGLLPEQTAMQIHRARELGARGFIVFNYDRAVADDHLPALRLGATAYGGPGPRGADGE